MDGEEQVMEKRKITIILTALITFSSAISSCGRRGYEEFVIPEQGPSTLQPIENIYRDNSDEELLSVTENTYKTVSSSDKLCEIQCKNSYYDVTLDKELGTPYDVGAAYAEAIQLAYENYTVFCEGYIFENINAAFNDLNNDYSSIEKRTDHFFSSLDKEYKDELEGFADTISGNSTGIKEDGILSKEEAILIQFVPDVLRSTACSAISANGKTTSTGERLTCRLLEWQLGSDNQLCENHAFIHMKNGDKSFVSLSYLGSLTILSAVNNDGLMLGELDVGSDNMVEYTSNNKISYTYALRYALENCTNAKEAATYLVSNASQFPYCVNVLATDKSDAFVAELCVSDEIGTSLIRDSNTPLMTGVDWNNPNYICAVNSFAAEGNNDNLSLVTNNIIRWKRYNELFCNENNLSLKRMKQLMTCEKTDNDLYRIRSNNLVHMMLADYSTCKLHALLTGKDGVDDKPVFIDLGSWK